VGLRSGRARVRRPEAVPTVGPGLPVPLPGSPVRRRR
jgi:hypothetical protein